MLICPLLLQILMGCSKDSYQEIQFYLYLGFLPSFLLVYVYFISPSNCVKYKDLFYKLMQKILKYNLESLGGVPRSTWKVFKFKAIFLTLRLYLLLLLLSMFSTSYMIGDDIIALADNEMYADKVHIFKDF